MTVLQTIALPLGYSAAALGAGAIRYGLPPRVSMPGFGEIRRFFKKAGARQRGFSKRFLLMLDEPGAGELDGHSA
jgi:hypothetical protein